MNVAHVSSVSLEAIIMEIFSSSMISETSPNDPQETS